MNEKTEISWSDIHDRLVKDRCGIGYLSENVADYQLRALLLLIEESMMVSEQMIKFMLDKGLDKEVRQYQYPAEDCPFD